MRIFCSSLLFALILSSLSLGRQLVSYRPVIPKTWDQPAIDSLQMPIADPRVSTKLVSSVYYYSFPVRPV
jgi:hypothetical protein